VISLAARRGSTADVRQAMGKPGKRRKPQESSGPSGEGIGDWISKEACFTVVNI
jgi:hypothetical protein